MFCVFFKFVKLDILDFNVYKNVFIYIMDWNVDLNVNVLEKMLLYVWL